MNELEAVLSYGAAGIVSVIGVAHFKGYDWDWDNEIVNAMVGGVCTLLFWPIVILGVTTQYLATRSRR